MKCPFCGKENTRVIDSRPSDDDSSIRRRRQCDGCMKRFTTYENVEVLPVVVIKKDQTREPYDRVKLREGIFRSCIKRPVSMEQQDNILDKIENTIFERESKEIPTVEIGEMVLEQLRDLDAVAYIRFASVYRDFADMEGFKREIEHLQNKNKKK
ncbi:MAG: transcriptional repressor NrdR [Lachnospiraceae bacterium]|jgi:transcriptional repressor NrdR|nr:transcriptional repressor NrdR [Lachnospiraceae bacterium]MCR4801472.1 transcriptional regulator NrdR [Lachnospiraceae bacterium]